MNGKLIYKCRNCGKEVKHRQVPDIELALNFILDAKLITIIDEKNKWLLNLKKTDKEIHECARSLFGVMDLIGAEQD